jgi:hypothetical protein
LRTDPQEILEVHDGDIMTTVTVMDGEGKPEVKKILICHRFRRIPAVI